MARGRLKITDAFGASFVIAIFVVLALGIYPGWARIGANNIWDTCMLLPGFTRTACASWVQAWGSIGAICAAVWIGHRSAAVASQGAKNHYILFKAGVRDVIAATLNAAGQRDEFGLQYARAELRDAVQLGETVPLHLLEPLDALTAVRFRSVLANAAVAVDFACQRGLSSSRYELLTGQMLPMKAKLDEIERE